MKQPNQWATWMEERNELLEDPALPRLLESAMRDLSPRDLYILEHRSRGRSLEDIGTDLNISHVASRKAWERTKARIRQSLLRHTLTEDLFYSEEVRCPHCDGII